MIEMLEKIPIGVLLVFAFFVAAVLVVFLSVAVRQGRELSLWPPKLGPLPAPPTPPTTDVAPHVDVQSLPATLLGNSNSDTLRIVPYSSVNWDALIEEATHTFRASGFALVKIVEMNSRRLLRKIKELDGFRAEVFLGDPFSPAAAMRARDENDNYLAPQVIARVAIQVDDARAALGTLGKAERLVLKHFPSYPTMAVVLIDNDLYAYFYPLGELGTDSPIIIISSYSEHPLAQFFVEHLEKTARASHPIPRDKLANLLHLPEA